MARILVMCTGNINRSPFTAALLQPALDGRHEVDSAGFTADGMVPPHKMIDAAKRHGVDLEHHRSTLVTEARLDAADLIVLMERSHQASLAGVSIDAPVRGFLLAELVDRLRADPPSSGLTLVDWVGAQRRTTSEVLYSRSPDIADPMGRPGRAYRRAANEMSGLARAMAQMLPTR